MLRKYAQYPPYFIIHFNYIPFDLYGGTPNALVFASMLGLYHRSIHMRIDIPPAFESYSVGRRHEAVNFSFVFVFFF